MQSQSLQDLATKYLQYCELMRNYAPLTVKSYQECFKLFFRDTDLKNTDQLTKQRVEEWFFNGRLNRKWSPVSFRHYHKRINTFMKWLVEKDYIPENHAEKIEKPRMEHKIPRTLSKNQAQLVLDASFHIDYRFKYEKYRNQGCVGIMLLAGLRKREVINLKLNDVRFDDKNIFINQGKGQKDRLIPMNIRLKEILSEYLKQRCRLKKQSLYFFTGTNTDDQLSIKTINRLIFRLKQKTKVSFSAHTLRHAFATLMLEGGCDIYTLSKIMGHAKITTTTIYLQCSSAQMSKSIEMHSLN